MADLEIEVTPDLSEEDATAASVDRVVSEVLALKEPVALCTHRPVLPLVLTALGLQEQALEPGSFLAVHHRRGSVLAVEQVKAPSGR